MRKTLLLVATGCVAFSSMTYEWLLTHFLASLLGNTMVRFASSMGVYLFALGVGAFLQGRLVLSAPWTVLFFLEVLLAFLGIVMPFALFGGDWVITHLVSFGGLEAFEIYILWTYMYFWVFT